MGLDVATIANRRQIGAKKFVLLHHGCCYRNSFHYRINTRGVCEHLVSDSLRTQHPNAISIQLEGNFNRTSVPSIQLEALKTLLLELKLRYPAIQVGGHRQVRGDKRTTCPGTRFPLRQLHRWCATNLIEERDDHLREVIESQYRP